MSTSIAADQRARPWPPSPVPMTSARRAHDKPHPSRWTLDRAAGDSGGFADLEFALAATAGLIGPHTVCVTTVHELQVRPAGTVPLAGHDVPVDFIITPDRVIDCRPGLLRRPAVGI